MDVELQCPHCAEYLIVNTADMNCRIFRHAVMVATLAPIHPHASKGVCDALVAAGAVHGCAKPFRVVQTQPGGVFSTEICDYI